MLCDLEHSLVEVLDRLYPPYRYDDILYSQDSAPNDGFNSSGSGGLPSNGRAIVCNGSSGALIPCDDCQRQNNNDTVSIIISNTTNNTRENTKHFAALLLTHQLSHADISVETNETTADNRTEHELSMSEFRADEKLREFLRVEQIRASKLLSIKRHLYDGGFCSLYIFFLAVYHLYFGFQNLMIFADSYRGTHLHSVDMCCGGMTEGQVKVLCALSLNVFISHFSAA